MVWGRAKQQKGLVASVVKKTIKKTGNVKGKTAPSAKKAVPLKSAPVKSTPAKSASPKSASTAAPSTKTAKAGKISKTVKSVKKSAKVDVSTKSSKAQAGTVHLTQSAPDKATRRLLAKNAKNSSQVPVVKIKKLKKVKAPKFRAEIPPVRLPPPPVTSDSKMQKNRAGLNHRDLEYFRGLLLDKRRELLGDVTSMEREALRSGNTNLSNLPLHMADTGTDNYEQEFTLGLVEKDRQMLREIQLALAKIQDGSYGVCEGTGKPISRPRLEAKPWAKYSIEHARQLEKPMFRRAY